MAFLLLKLHDMDKKLDLLRRIIPVRFDKSKRFLQKDPPPRAEFLPAVEQAFSDCADFVCALRRVDGFTLPVCHMEGLCSGSELSQCIYRPLTELHPGSPEELYGLLASGTLRAGGMELCSDADTICADLLRGRCALLFPQGAITYDIRSGDKRSIDGPTLERSLLGPRDAFTEDLRTNTALLRRHLRSPELKLRELNLGSKSATRIALVWLDGKGGEKYAGELYERLSAACIDSVTAVGDVETLIAPYPRGAFPQFHATERPDRVSRHLLSGQVGIFTDGIPVALLAPCTLPELLRVSEDRSQHALTASALLLLRWAALLISLLLPGLYLSISLYHQEMLPTELLQSIIAAKQDVPFSTASEILGMLSAFALLQEAGYRLPDGAGSSVSIIGSLIVGQSAVEARVVSPIAVIIVALSGIAGFTLPDRTLDAAVRMWRFIFVICALALGIYGVMAGFLLLLWRLCGMENQGVSYLYPLCDGERRFRSTFLRLPLQKR